MVQVNENKISDNEDNDRDLALFLVTLQNKRVNMWSIWRPVSRMSVREK